MRFFVGVLRPPLMLFTRRDWRGGPLPSEGFVLATNHVSHFDPLAVAHFVNDSGLVPRFLAKSELMDMPVIGRLIAAAGQIPVYRQSTDASRAFAAAVEAVRQGDCVIVYPEGTITKDPQLWPMVGKTGAARIALTTGCPVIPVAHWGAQEVLAPYSKRLRLLPRKTIHVLVGDPVDLEDLRGHPITPAMLREGTERIMAAVTGLLEELRHETAPSRRFDPKTHGLAAVGPPGRPPRRRRPVAPVDAPRSADDVPGPTDTAGGTR